MIDLIIIIMAGIVLLFLLSCCFMVARLLDEEISMYGTRAVYVILSEDGAVVMNDCYNGFDEEARRNIQNFMQQQAAKEQEQQRQQQVQSQKQPNGQSADRKNNL